MEAAVNKLCPYCEGPIKLSELMQVFTEMEYPSFFSFECSHCGEDIDVETIPIPTFTLRQK